MASTIGGGINEDGSLQNTIVIDEADLGKIDIVQLNNAGVTELAINSPIADLEVGLKGDVDTAIVGARMVDAVVTNEAPKGEVATMTVAVTKAKNFTFETAGKGTTDLTIAEGKFTNGSITTSKGKAPDSISFGQASIVKSVAIDAGKGDDSIVFSGKLKGNSTVESGKGADVIEVNGRRGKGKLILSDFSKKDELVIDGESFTNSNIEDAPKWIKLEEA